MPAVGGVARRATIITQERKKNDFVLVLDAGDSLTGDQDPALRTQGQSSVEAMNRLGYDAMALGPADLALGPNTLRQRISEAKFPLLSANAVISATGEALAKPYIVRELAGHRLAIVGLSGGNGTAEIAVRDPVAAAQEIVRELQGQADIVLVLSHAGPATDQRIADQAPGIAAIVGGGVGALTVPWRSKKTGTLLFHADSPAPGHAGRNLGIATLNFDAGGKLVADDWKPLPLGPDIADDPTMAAWTQEQINH